MICATDSAIGSGVCPPISIAPFATRPTYWSVMSAARPGTNRARVPILTRQIRRRLWWRQQRRRRSPLMMALPPQRSTAGWRWDNFLKWKDKKVLHNLCSREHPKMTNETNGKPLIPSLRARHRQTRQKYAPSQRSRRVKNGPTSASYYARWRFAPYSPSYSCRLYWSTWSRYNRDFELNWIMSNVWNM